MSNPRPGESAELRSRIVLQTADPSFQPTTTFQYPNPCKMINALQTKGDIQAERKLRRAERAKFTESGGN